MRKKIEFNETNGECDLTTPWQRPERQFQDLILQTSYSALKAKLFKGSSTIRVLPAIKGSQHWWMPIHALNHNHGQHTHPKTYESDTESVFDQARSWLKKHAPETLYAKSTGEGFMLWPKPMAACWLLIEQRGRTNLKILLASAFAGAKSNKAGLAHQIFKFVQTNKELLDPENKYAIEVTRTLPEDSQYLETSFELTKSDKTLNEAVAELPSEQLRMICPIEYTVRRIDPDQEWRLLEQTIGTELTSKIRTSITPKLSPEGGD